MVMLLKVLYRKITPEKMRHFVYWNLIERLYLFWTELKCKWFLIVPAKNEKQKAYRIMEMTEISPFPYLWKTEYDKQHYMVNMDTGNGLPYVNHNGKKLYYKKGTLLSVVESMYRTSLLEQDKRSAHCYINNYEELRGKTLLDIGAAEGNFALDVIEYVEHVYLFECEKGWVEALESTFAPWKEKVTIIQKYVSDIDDENNITLDTYFKDKKKENLYLKMDIEGYERKALKGAVNLLTFSKNIGGSVCIYHLRDDELVIKNMLKTYGLEIQIAPGYLFMCWSMRHGILRFNRNT